MVPALASALQLAPDGPARLAAAYGRLKGADVTERVGALEGALQEAWGPQEGGGAAAAAEELQKQARLLEPRPEFHPLVNLAFKVCVWGGGVGGGMITWVKGS
jgi:hypothetical protein